MGSGARLLLAALVAGAFAFAWWTVSSDGGRSRAAVPALAVPGAEAPSPTPAVARPPTAARSTAGGDAPDPRPAASEPRALEVIVFDELGQPLPGARVRTRAGEWFTDERGHAQVPYTVEEGAVPPGRDGSRRLRLAVDKPGYFHADRTPRLRSQVFVELRRAIPLGGAVSDRDGGGPISAAQVSFRHRDCVGCAPEVALSDGNGRYRFEAVPVGSKLELLIEAEGYVAARSSFRVEAEAQGALHDVLLGRGLPVAVVVLDAETRAPIAGAQLRGATDNRARGLRATVNPARGLEAPLETDAAGRVESDQLMAVGEPRGKWLVSAPGYCQLTLWPSVSALSESPESIVPLVRAVTVAGRVVDPRGRPVGGAELAWDAGFAWDAKTAGEPLATWLADLPKWSLGRERDGSESAFTSDAEGRFRLRGAVPWTPGFTLTASAPNGERGSSELTLPGPGGNAQVLVELRPEGLAAGTATIRGRFTLNGEPERGTVYWRGATRGGSARPDQHGAFELRGVEPGPVELFARSERVLARSTCTLADMGPFAVYAAAGAELERDLALALPFDTIEGRVSDASGTPFADLPVEAEDPARCWRERARTDAEGRYRLEVPADLGAFEVAVERGPERLTRGGVAPGASGVDFVLAQLGRLRFRAFDEDDGTLITKGRLDWRGPGSPFRELADLGRRVPDPAGWYELDCPAGTLDLCLSTRRERHVTKQLSGVVVLPARTTAVEFPLRQSLTRHITLDDESIPLPEAFAAVLIPAELWNKVRFSPEPRPHWEGLGQRSPSDELRFKPNGTARARGLKPGGYRIKVWPETLSITPDHLRLKASEVESTVHVRLDWR